MLKDFLETLNDAPFIFHSIDRNGKIQFVSQGWLDLLGYSRNEVMGCKSVEFLTPESRSYAEAVVLPDFWKTGRCKNIHYKMIAKNGEILDILLNGIAQLDDDGKNFQSLASLVDITDRIKVESELRQYKDDLELLVLERTEQLQETTEMYQTLSKVSPVGIFRTDAKGRYVYVNQTWKDFTGMSRQEALGNKWLDAVHPDDREEVKKVWDNAMADGEEFHLEYRLINSDGEIIWVLGQARTVNGGHKGYVGTCTDITIKKEVLPQLIELKQYRCRSV